MRDTQMMAGKSFFRKEFPSTAVAMRDAVTSALTALEERDWLAEDQRFYAHLCLEEAVVNAMNHGNRGDQNLSVSLEMLDEGEDCRVIVRDQGDGFCLNELQKPPAEAIGGRGVFLIKSFKLEQHAPHLMASDLCFRIRLLTGQRLRN